jgi:hypothetical protein
MSNREAKRWRKQYRKKIDDMANMALKKEIFRLARNRDILGLVVIGESILIAILLILVFFIKGFSYFGF